MCQTTLRGIKICGIVGVINKYRNGFTPKQLDVLETLIYMDTLRGDDSTGIFAVNNLGNVGIAKEVGTGESFLKTDTWNKEYRPQLFKEGWACIGHNRKATRGSVSDENAHPFWVDDKIVLVHNGSFNGSHKHLKDTNVDSEAIAHMLAERGEGTVESVLQKVNAAYALIWYDVHNKTIQIIRNSERPLAWAETADGYYFASEVAMLRFALDRHGVKVIDQIYTFPEYSLNSYKLEEDKGTSTDSVQLDCKYRWTGATSSRAQEYPFQGTKYTNPLACGYECSDYSDFATATQPTVTNIRELNHTRIGLPKLTEVKVQPEVIQMNSMEGKAEVTVMPWMKRVTCGNFAKLREKYQDGNKIRVVIDDFFDADQLTSSVMVTGKTLDEASIPVLFKLPKETIEKLTEPNCDSTTFDITISGCSWRNTDKRNLRSIDDAEGIMVIRGTSPVMYTKALH